MILQSMKQTLAADIDKAYGLPVGMGMPIPCIQSRMSFR